MTFENTQTYIETTYTVIEYVAGHYKSLGKDAGVMKKSNVANFERGWNRMYINVLS